MALPQQKFREIVFQLLYSYDLTGLVQEEVIAMLSHTLEVSKRNIRLAQERMRALLALKEQLDEKIAKTSSSYSFDRIQTVEKNILRLGVFELFYDDTIPPKVAISEALRLARKFGTPESAGFVNAILDALYKEKSGETSDHQLLIDTAKALEQMEEQAQDAAKNKAIPADEKELESN